MGDFVPLQLDGLSNSLDVSKIPVGKLFSGDNCYTYRGFATGAPRYGRDEATAGRWRRGGAAAGDVGRGFAYAEFESYAEFIVLVKHSGSATVSAYTVNPTTFAYTAITHSRAGYDPIDAAALPDGEFDCQQFGENLYILNRTTGTMYRRRVGGSASTGESDDEWDFFRPEATRVISDYLQPTRPEYPALDIGGGWTTLSSEKISQNSPHKLLVEAPDATNDIFKVYCESTGSGGNQYNVAAYIVLDALADTDLRGVDYLILDTFRDRSINANDPSEQSGFLAWISESTTALATPADVLAFKQAITTPPAVGQTVKTVDGWTTLFDFSGYAESNKNAVRKFLVAMSFNAKTPFKVVCKWYTGGAKMWDRPNDPVPEETEYGYAYFGTGIGARGATKIFLAPNMLGGDPAADGLGNAGAWVTVSAPFDAAAAAAGYDKVQFYRLEHGHDQSVETHWRYINDSVLNNAGPGPITLLDKRRESTLSQLTEVHPNFNLLPSGWLPACIGLWKQHLGFAFKRRLYLSYAGQPARLLPAPEDIVKAPEPSPDIGRTVYVSEGRVEDVVSIVSQDSLYLNTLTSTHVMVGDSAGDATQPRRLPQSRGTVGPLAAMKWKSGQMVGALDGLWYYEVSRAFTGSQDGTYNFDEVTKGVRDSWTRLLGSGSSNLMVTQYKDEIWCLCYDGTSSRYLWLSRPDPETGERRWHEGKWLVPVGDAGTYINFKRVVSVPSRGGMFVMDDKGRMWRLAYRSDGTQFTEDGQTHATAASGTQVTWTGTTGKFIAERREVMGVMFHAIGTPKIKMTIWDGVSAGPVYWPGPTANDLYTKPSNQVLVDNLRELRPGFAFQVTVQGIVGTDTVEAIGIEYEPRTRGQGA